MEISDILAPPDVYTAEIVLAIQPHYDDNDIAAGGTLAALSQNGAAIHYLTVTDDLVGVLNQSLSDGHMTVQLREEQQLSISAKQRSANTKRLTLTRHSFHRKTS